MLNTTRFYVYHWLRKDGTPYYVGKGQTNRATDKRRRYIPSPDRIKLIKVNLTEKQAHDFEKSEISKYGRKDLGTGILRNKTEGGDGHVPGPETRLKLSLALKGKNKGNPAWNKGLKGVQKSNKKGGNRPDLTPEIRARMSEKVRAYKLGKKMSDESKKKISKANKGNKRPDMIGNKLSSGARDNSAFRTPEWRQMLSERMKKRWANGLHTHQRWANA